MTSATLRVFGWVVPLLCMGTGSYATYSQYRRLQTANQTEATKKREYQTAIQTLELARSKVQSEGRFAAVPRIDAEETLFLNDLRLRAQKADVEIVNWRTSSAPAADAAAKQDPQKTQLLKGITKVTSDLTLEGAYGRIRAFVEDLTQTSRLYTINNAQWSRGAKAGTQLTITVSRYVTEPLDSSTNRTEAKPLP